MKFIFPLFFVVLFACSSPKENASETTAPRPKDEGVYVVLHKVDNQAKIYVNDSLVYASAITNGEPDIEKKVEITEYLSSDSNRVKVDLINGNVDGKIGNDSHWSIYYEIFQNGEPIDFVNKDSREGGTGVVYSMEHDVFVN